MKKISSWNKDEKRDQILSKIYRKDPEGYDLVWGIVDLSENFAKITGRKLFGEDNIGEPSVEELKELRYFFTDLSEVVYNAKQELERDSNQDYKPTEQENSHQVDFLEQQIEELKKQKQELEAKLANNNQLTSEQRQSLKDQLSSNEELLNERGNKLNSLRKNSLLPSNDNKLVIGLGIAAVVIVVVSLIILLGGSNRRRKYY